MQHRTLLALVALAASCASSRDAARPAPERFDASVAALAEELVEAAERRTSLASMRVVIDDLVAVPSNTRRYAVIEALEREDASLAATLEHELGLALADRVHVFATGGPLDDGRAAEVALRARAEALGATHAVLGTFVRDGGELDVTLRLVELETQWVVASVRDRLPYVPPPGYDAAVRPRRGARVADARDAVELPAVAAGARTVEPPPEVDDGPPGSIGDESAGPGAVGDRPRELPLASGPAPDPAPHAAPHTAPAPESAFVPADFDPTAEHPAGPGALRLGAARTAASGRPE